MVKQFTQAHRVGLLAALAYGHAAVARKKARVVAIRIDEDFSVETDRGIMEGKTGDWLVTNHPDDDEGSDLWTISDERFRATYVVDEKRARSMEPKEDYGNGDSFSIVGEPYNLETGPDRG